MSLLQVAARIQQTADSLLNSRQLLEQSGREIVKEVLDNIDRGQLAGQFRPDMDTSGATPGSAMKPISRYTAEHRSGDHLDPLKDTGQLRREIGLRNATAVHVVVGGTTTRARMLLRKHMGSDISGIGSTDLDRLVPYRSPMGYSAGVLARVLSLWDKALGADGHISGSAKYEVRL